eukprot:6107971-Pyramimonas_sp.AAC.1
MATCGRSWELHAWLRKCYACCALRTCISKSSRLQRAPCSEEEMLRLPRFGSVLGKASAVYGC